MIPAAVAIGLAGICAVTDWRAVADENRRLEYWAKPAVMVSLIAAALLIEAPSEVVRAWFVAALVFSLAGDVFLMLEREQFVAGLAAFLIAHIAYAGGLVAAGLGIGGAALGAALTTGGAIAFGRTIVGAVRRRSPRLATPVTAYMIAISGMVVASFGTGNAVAIVGALLFYASDATLGWNRFVEPIRHGRLAVIVTYHAGQTLLVASLAVL